MYTREEKIMRAYSILKFRSQQFEEIELHKMLLWHLY